MTSSEPFSAASLAAGVRTSGAKAPVCASRIGTTEEVAEKTLDVVIPSVARNLLFLATLKGKQVPQPGKHRRASE